ncbi:hypothetical protein [Pradoshia sp.]
MGQLLVFAVISSMTADWRYMMWSLIVAMTAGVSSIINTWQAQKRADKEMARKS